MIDMQGVWTVGALAMIWLDHWGLDLHVIETLVAGVLLSNLTDWTIGVELRTGGMSHRHVVLVRLGTVNRRVTFHLLLFCHRDRDPDSVLLYVFGHIEGRIGLFLMLLRLLFSQQLLQFSHFLGIAALTKILESGILLLGVLGVGG